MQNQESEGAILHLVELVGLGIELLAVALIVLGILGSLIRYLVVIGRGGDRSQNYHNLRSSLGKTLLLGLEILVAADIIRTVALDPSIQNVAALGLLVLVRTFLSWSITVEIEHRWPWSRRSEE